MQIIQSRKKSVPAGIMLAFALVFLLSISAGAAVRRNEWFSKKGKYYYYNAKGKKLTGKKKIGKRWYYFSKKGVQLHGWRKIGKNYYYFRYKDGKKGYMVTSASVNGIRLKKNGTANLRKAEDRRKAELLANYVTWVEEFTKPSMTKQEKLLACLEQMRKLRYYGEGDDVLREENWDVICAEDVYYRHFGMFRGNCYRYAVGLGYMASAAGFEKVELRAVDGHGWTMINGKLYDTTKTVIRGVMTYFPAKGKELAEFTADPPYVRII